MEQKKGYERAITGIKIILTYCSNLKPIRKQTVYLNTFGNNNYRNEVEITALFVPEICTPLPASIDIDKFPYLQGYELADSYTNMQNFTERPINLLIGSDQYYDIVTGDTVKNLDTGKGPVAVSSIFGYLIFGPTQENDSNDELRTSSNLISHCFKKSICIKEQSDEIIDTLKRFWETEESGTSKEQPKDDNDVADEHEKFPLGIRFENKRYEVKLPWLTDIKMPPLSDNSDLCHRRLNSLMFRLRKDKNLLTSYNNVFQEQLSLGIIERVPESEYENPDAYVLPHHPVVKNERNTTKCRVVFDTSSKDKDNEFCLNGYLEGGPNTIQNIFDVMINFRSQPVGLTSDIQSVFLQIGIDPTDRENFVFLWYDDISSDQPILVQFRFARFPFGLKPSPPILAKVIEHHLDFYEDTEPQVVKELRRLYVDDYAGSFNDQNKAFTTYKTAKQILTKMANK